MDLSRLDVQTYFAYDIDELNKKYGEGNWRFVYWKVASQHTLRSLTKRS